MEKKQFKSESKRLMDLMIHSIYTNKEIFLRELISNASDAIDKVYYKTLTDKDKTFNKDDYYIRIHPNKDNRTLTIEDTGIGMTAAELEDNLGTIAKSGSSDFKDDQEMEEDFDLIGQFGVGFYSAFMVSDKVEVETKSFDEETSSVWVSEGADGYTIEPGTRTTHGSKITLYLKENSEDNNYDDYLEPYRIRQLVEHYSNFIRYPIKMVEEKSRVKEDTKDSENPEYETYLADDVLNSMIPIWRKNKNELTDEDYNNFYHDKRLGFDAPLAHVHLSIEGAMSYKAILYIPGQAPFDYYTRDYEKGLELYSNGVLIMEKCSELLPDYFSFVKGVVDSEDISLNISREMLQQDRQLRLISRKIDTRISEELKKMLANERETYEKFFTAFGNQIKVGTYDKWGQDKEKLQDFLLFYSSKEGKMVTLKEYVERMPEDQKYIYYATGSSVSQLEKLPQVSIIKNKNYEILYLTETIDEFVTQTLKQYQDKEFRSVSSQNLGLEAPEENQVDDDTKTSEVDEKLLAKMKDLIGDEVVKVKTTAHLKDDVAYLSTEGDLSIEMEMTLNTMPQGGDVKAKKVLEINKNHPVYEKLKSYYEVDDDQFALYTELLYNQARLIAGLPLDDVVAFTKNISKLM
ncbi:MAG: molecular chaperone HtpG [Acetobacterium sp.]|jgi:molecular chaperone HtpG|uniref:molecular chaperone HtpG n=1 Tax=unclassified Acetobacterium TaxID=2638182 RepID=UPI000DBEB8CD|nr:MULTISPECIES: molecular chaperone HtpG [unclassified Acetobacterium]AWW25468.1 molecular chaperone HtpG [Acetobacterium sp. KB-1]MDK2941032.1 molecular chaperone HtpG [Acetobacterium sp.]MDZ5723980.1 molecular chaperone HtpG [Acetobacterium sp. K1/6]